MFYAFSLILKLQNLLKAKNRQKKGALSDLRRFRIELKRSERCVSNGLLSH